MVDEHRTISRVSIGCVVVVLVGFDRQCVMLISLFGPVCLVDNSSVVNGVVGRFESETVHDRHSIGFVVRFVGCFHRQCPRIGPAFQVVLMKRRNDS